MSASGLRRRSLARGAAVITIATAVSRVTGFVRVVVVAFAMGTTFLANTYQSANTAPNVVFELVAAGVLTSVFVPTFVEYLVKDRAEEGWDAANALSTVALVSLVALAGLLALAAPLIMRVLTLGVAGDELRSQEIELGATLLRLFAPQVVFYGAGMIMTSALHAHRRFAIAAVAPIFNNVVVIGVYLAYAFMRGNAPPTVDGITTSQTLVLGFGTTAGVVAMTVCLLPSLRKLGWSFSLRWDPKHPAVRKAARLGLWALGYAGGYQAGLIVVLLLANRIEGGVAAYQWAYTFFYLPHALFAVPIFHVLFPAMSEHAARGENQGLVERLRDGLGMLYFVLLPTAAILLVVSGPLATITLDYGVMTAEGAALVGRVIAAFALGLPAYSTFLVLTRAYYALNDTKSPALVNALTVALASALGAALFVLASDEWAVPALAAAHSYAFIAGAVVLGRALSDRVGRIRNVELERKTARALVLSLAAIAVMILLRFVLPDGSRLGALGSVVLVSLAGAGVYVTAMKRLNSPELGRLLALVRRKQT